MLKPVIVRQLFVLFVIAIVGFLIVYETLPYLTGVLGAITIYVILNPFMKKMINRGMNKALSASILMFASFLVILLPLTGIVLMLGNKIGKAVRSSEEVTNALKEQVITLERKLGFEIGPQIETGRIADMVSNSLQSIAGGTFNILISVAIMYLLLYYMLIHSKDMIDTFYKYLPFKRENLELIGRECQSMVRANAIGIPVVAIVQGIVALIGYLIFGARDP